MFPSYRNQSVDLQSKSTDWFLYDGNIGREKVNNEDTRTAPNGAFFCENPLKAQSDVVLVSLWLTWSRVHTFFWSFHWASKCWLGGDRDNYSLRATMELENWTQRPLDQFYKQLSCPFDKFYNQSLKSLEIGTSQSL